MVISEYTHQFTIQLVADTQNQFIHYTLEILIVQNAIYTEQSWKNNFMNLKQHVSIYYLNILRILFLDLTLCDAILTRFFIISLCEIGGNRDTIPHHQCHSCKDSSVQPSVFSMADGRIWPKAQILSYKHTIAAYVPTIAVLLPKLPMTVGKKKFIYYPYQLL